MSVLLKGEGIVAGYKNKEIIKGIDFVLKEGEVCALIGNNGSGKTTLLKTVCGLLPYRGQLFYRHQNLKTLSLKQRARKMGYLSQNSSMTMSLTVLETILMGYHPVLKLMEKVSEEQKEYAQKILELFFPPEIADVDFQTLSGGQKQLVMIARTLVKKPEILILDEPDSALDFQHKHRLLKILKDGIKSKKQGMILCSHDINISLKYADRIMIMNQGLLICDLELNRVTEEGLKEVLSEIYGPVEIIKTKDQFLITGGDDNGCEVFNCFS